VNHWVIVEVATDPLTSPLHTHETGRDRNVYIPPGTTLTAITTIETPWTCELLETDSGDNVCLYVWGEIHYRTYSKRNAASNSGFSKGQVRELASWSTAKKAMKQIE